MSLQIRSHNEQIECKRIFAIEEQCTIFWFNYKFNGEQAAHN